MRKGWLFGRFSLSLLDQRLARRGSGRRQALHGIGQKVDTAIDLAHRDPFPLGTSYVEPATRRISVGDLCVTVQPRIMQVLLALVDARGAVVSRDDIARQCWTARFVAEDSLNAAIAELRKAFRSVGSDDVSVETIPKTGYRIVAPDLDQPVAADGDLHTRRGMGRLVIGGGVVVVAAASGLALWTRTRSQFNSADDLIARGTQALRQGLPDPDAQGVDAFRRAVEIEPGNAKAWGLLALAWRATAEYAEPARATDARRSAELAARRALAIDARQSDALAALALLVPSFGQWAQAERRLRGVLDVDPTNTFARGAYGTLLMSTGQVAKCLVQLNWLVQRDPWSPNHQFRRIYTLWSDNRLAEMDRAADAAMQSWPRHPAIWFARFWTLVFTDRVAPAMKMLSDSATRPALPAPALRALDLALRALGGGNAQQRQAAISANLAASTKSPGQAVTGIMILSKLGEPGHSMQVAQGFLLRRGALVVEQRHPSGQPSITDQHHRMAMMLWVPATEPLRLHPEFESLCAGIGLVDYWRETGNRPDFRGGSLRNV